MAKNSITDYDNISGNNTDVQSVDISEGCSPSGINNAIREVMADLADVNDGTVALTSPQVNSLTLNGNASFGDNDKAIFGAGSDLQIYHDGSNSNIYEAGTGSLTIQTDGTKVGMAKASPFEWMLEANVDADVKLYYDGNQKLATTSTGIDVTGTVAATSYTGDGSSLTGISSGFAVVDQWYLNANWTTDGDSDITAWSQVSFTGTGKISGMTHSSSVFTFPQTGLYKVTANFMQRDDSSDNFAPQIQVTTNNSTYNTVATLISGSSGNVNSGSVSCSVFINVDDTSNVKVKFRATSMDANSYIWGSSTDIRTNVVFERIASAQ